MTRIVFDRRLGAFVYAENDEGPFVQIEFYKELCLHPEAERLLERIVELVTAEPPRLHQRIATLQRELDDARATAGAQGRRLTEALLDVQRHRQALRAVLARARQLRDAKPRRKRHV